MVAGTNLLIDSRRGVRGKAREESSSSSRSSGWTATWNSFRLASGGSAVSFSHPFPSARVFRGGGGGKRTVAEPHTAAAAAQQETFHSVTSGIKLSRRDDCLERRLGMERKASLSLSRARTTLRPTHFSIRVVGQSRERERKRESILQSLALVRRASISWETPFSLSRAYASARTPVFYLYMHLRARERERERTRASGSFISLIVL